MTTSATPSSHLAITALPEGHKLSDRYRLQALVGQGAASCVYRAHDERLDRTVALKILDPLRGPDPVGRARFEREFKILSELSIEGVAQCLELARHEDLDILVLEFIEGETLHNRLARGRLDIDAAVSIAAALARVVEQCHDKGVLHRDLKPSNVILHPERGPVVVDFGVAWVGAAANLTRTGAVIGSPQYMAPEIFASPLADARADVYSLGAILFEMLAGRPARLAEGVAELAMSHLRDTVPRVAGLRPGIERNLDEIVARALATDPEDRYATAAELHQSLVALRPSARAGVRTRTTCKACKTRLIIDLPFCPGCGNTVSWRLRPGPYAVQILEMRSLPPVVDWLTRRYEGALRASATALRSRLRHTPVPLAVGIDETSAERLLAEAEESGCRAEIVRARALFGPRLRASSATIGEMAATCALHVLATSTTTLAAKIVHAEMMAAMFSPSALALVGIALATVYVRRPLLTPARTSEVGDQHQGPNPIVHDLRQLKTDRARRLAATVIARATPVLTGDTAGLPSDGPQAVAEHLGAALAAARDVDTHAAVLAQRSRSRLALEMEKARAQIAAGNVEGQARLAALEIERTSLTEASLAHDLAARIVLERTQAIADILASRTSERDAHA